MTVGKKREGRFSTSGIRIMPQKPIVNYFQSKISIWRPCQDLSIAIILNLFLTLLIQSNVLVYGANGDRGIIAGGQGSRHITCPPASEILPCTCRVMSKGLDIVCDNADANHIQNALDRLKKRNFPIYWMKFRSCNLPRIKDYSFLSLDVKHLNIIRSNVSVIERSSLSALGSVLTDLDLSNNNIHEIPTASFHPLKTLTFLNLNYNKITSIHANAFDGMVLLERLSLYENHIKRIDDNAFKGIGRKLARLNLGKNQLSKIPTDTFHPLKNLFVLDLNENKITHLPDGAFLGFTIVIVKIFIVIVYSKGLHKLDMLKLEHNEIDSIQDNVFSDLTMLNSLNIEHNKITNISDKAFSGLENHLGWLELGHNLLDHIPSHALRPLHNLRQLDLDSNRIHVVLEDAFRGYGDTLKFLLLDKNHIENIPPLTFIDLHSLEWLKLSHNELRTLTEDTISPIIDTLYTY
ncbi:Leucine-rich repeats and immunoglobulin-like domains protein 2 [Armadillidium nasatum]|uniref:Leucine-rich repeats and immunoglobulin-like domains protein 2 n=1 Tax=Armadillidium nasatum TaxID=96803 RepID=A0A5N5SSU6_9CRUS|nr:Leucine-rich repeats and immunoglobulin-like domains protein 2 [Armadillidium nasatum]